MKAYDGIQPRLPADFTGQDGRAKIVRTNPTSNGSLLSSLASQMSDDHLEHIAACNYQQNWRSNLATLKDIQRGVSKLRPLDEEPRFVLELTRWTEPDATDREGRENELTGQDGHLVRAFSCALLLEAYTDPRMQPPAISYCETIINLTESITTAFPEKMGPHVEFMHWLFQSISNVRLNERVHCAVALLFATAYPGIGAPSAYLSQIGGWIIDREKIAFESENIERSLQNLPPLLDNPWLLRTQPFNTKKEKWRKLGADLVDIANRTPNGTTVPGFGGISSLPDEVLSVGYALAQPRLNG